MTARYFSIDGAQNRKPVCCASDQAGSTMPFLRERSGRWSPVKIVAFAAAFFPALWVAYQAATDDLGPRPVTEAIHQIGEWTLRLLLITLATPPAQRIP